MAASKLLSVAHLVLVTSLSILLLFRPTHNVHPRWKFLLNHPYSQQIIKYFVDYTDFKSTEDRFLVVVISILLFLLQSSLYLPALFLNYRSVVWLGISISEMGPTNNSSIESHNYFHRLSKALEFAVSEWLLMFLLVIDACFGYLIAKFASYCQLESPCLLCSRYDHVLAEDKTGIYWDSICNHHKSEISSVVLSHVHDKHVEGHGICENCPSSFTTKTKNKFNDETFQKLVEKMGSNPLLEDHNRDSSGVLRDYAENLLPTNSIHPDASESLFANDEHAKNEKNIFVDESLESFRSSNIAKNQIAPSLEAENQKVDINSDSESEFVVSEVHLKSDSHVEVSDLRHDLSTVAECDAEELKLRNDANEEDTSTNLAETPVDEFLETTDPPITNEVIKDPIAENDLSTTTNGHQVLNYLDLGDAYKLAISSKGRQLSGKLLDQKSFKDSSTRVSEDVKILMSHRSNDNLISPKLSFNSDELTSMQFLQRRISLERNESNLSFDGSVVSEIDGESLVDRLRRQIEHDKKLMGILYKELEEERNASAVATNQAMAMITRLQEEKAALYTEALQCLRMMEEQAEYNNETLQNANYLIEEKDKQIQDLEELLRKTSVSNQTDTIYPSRN